MSQQGRFHIGSVADIPQAIIAAEAAGAIGTATLLRALRDHRIALLPVQPETSRRTWKQWCAKARNRPAICLAGDDDYRNRGPSAWPLAERMAEWAASAMIHATGAERWHYDMAIEQAQRCGRVLLVEASSATAGAWQGVLSEALPRSSILTIVPTGGIHPLSLDAQVLQ